MAEVRQRQPKCNGAASVSNLLQVELDEAAGAVLPLDYDFELFRIVEFIRGANPLSRCDGGIRITTVALQLPEGLQRWGPDVARLVERFCPGVLAVVLADVSYGSCCVDDTVCRALGAQLLVHFGHSAVVPEQVLMRAGLAVLYVPVRIAFDAGLLAVTIKHHLAASGRQAPVGRHNGSDRAAPCRRLILTATAQFSHMLAVVFSCLAVCAVASRVVNAVLMNATEAAAIARVAQAVRDMVLQDFDDIEIPVVPPLPPGEILGCTAPHLERADDVDTAAVFVADGRFQLESLLLANPRLRLYRYDPYARTLSRQQLDSMQVWEERRTRIVTAARAVKRRVGLILGTLGRQGSLLIVQDLQERLQALEFTVVVKILFSEISPEVVERLGKDSVDFWIQVACPRLSADWPKAFGSAVVLSLPEAEELIMILQTECLDDFDVPDPRRSPPAVDNWAAASARTALRREDF